MVGCSEFTSQELHMNAVFWQSMLSFNAAFSHKLEQEEIINTETQKHPFEWATQIGYIL